LNLIGAKATGGTASPSYFLQQSTTATPQRQQQHEGHNLTKRRHHG
jgi:hypothetical protein